MPVVQNSQSLRAGVINVLMETWRQRMPVFDKQQKILVRNLPYTNIRKAFYAWKEALPFPEKWPYSSQRTYKTLKDRLIAVSLIPFQVAIPYNIYDKQDDQLGDLQSHVSHVINRYGQLPDKLLSEYLNGVKVLNDSLNNCYDGVGLFSTVDGDGNNRFGVVGGNIVASSGVSSAAIVNDIASCQRRFLNFQDTEGQPIFMEDDANYSKLDVIVPNALNEVFQKVTNQELIRSDPASITAESNYLKGTFRYHLNPYLTNPAAYYVVIDHEYWKAFVYRQPGKEGLRQIFADFSNSDRAREFNEEILLTDIRTGLGPWFSATIIKVSP